MKRQVKIDIPSTLLRRSSARRSEFEEKAMKIVNRMAIALEVYHDQPRAAAEEAVLKALESALPELKRRTS
jgi:hypothetical protein